MESRLIAAAKAARKAGMTYGQYMAEKGYREIPSPERNADGSVYYCKICRKPIPPGKRRTYCSAECSRKGSNTSKYISKRRRYDDE